MIRCEKEIVDGRTDDRHPTIIIAHIEPMVQVS